MLTTLPKADAPRPVVVPDFRWRALLAATVACGLLLTLAVVSLFTTHPHRTTTGHGVAGVSAGPAPALRRPACGWSATLVPACGRWWGVAPMAHTTTPIPTGLADEEDAAGRPMDILHVYHINGQLFPTPTERALALDKAHPRMLLINWKPATDTTWRAVAMGAADARIDALAKYINTTFRHRFFLAIYHEPEDNVVPTAGSGMTAADYAAMYRHVVLRLRADRVTYAVTVMNYMGFDKWALQSWFAQLWPGNDVVDWIGLDPYAVGKGVGTPSNDFATMVNRPQSTFPGYYTWATRTHPGKPIILSEWGVEAGAANIYAQAQFFTSMGREIARFPAIKALIYFDMPTPPVGQWVTYLRAFPQTTAAYRRIGRLPAFLGPAFHYVG